MTKKNCTEQQVRESIKTALNDLRLLMREDVKLVWKKLNKQDQYKMARSLAALNHVAKNPELYFSREHTEQAWFARAREYAAQTGLQDWYDAFYIVQDPTGQVYDTVSNGLFPRVMWLNELYNFGHMIQNWEYKHTSESIFDVCTADVYAKDIMLCAQKYKRLADEKKVNPVKRKVMELCRSFSR